MEFATDFADGIVNNNEEDLVVDSGSGRQKGRRAGELSGRQMVLKKLEKEEKEFWHYRFPPSFGMAVVTLRRVPLEFTDGCEENINKETASAMQIYLTRKLGFTVSVSLPFTVVYLWMTLNLYFVLYRISFFCTGYHLD